LFCPNIKLAIEIDGYQFHEGQEVKDSERQKAIEKLGIRFLRISAQGILKHPYDVAQLIIQTCTGEINLEDLEP
jgi:very-short-patch-repair endonuclease